MNGAGKDRVAPAAHALATRFETSHIVLGEKLCGIRQSRFRQRYESWFASVLPDVDQGPGFYRVRAASWWGVPDGGLVIRAGVWKSGR